MDQEIAPHLHATRDLLAGSLQMHPSEQAPALPDELARDFARRFATGTNPQTARASRSWFAALQSFVARPAFGLTAVALVIVGFAVPSMLGTKPARTGSFRGAGSETATTAGTRIVLVGAPAGTTGLLKDFEAGSLSSVDRLSAAPAGQRVVVDFSSGQITAINAAGETVDTTAIPADSTELTAAIASALGKL